MSDLINNITGNSKFENLKLFNSLVQSFIKQNNNTVMLIDNIKKDISISRSEVPIDNTINFKFVGFIWHYAEGKEHVEQLLEININYNVSKRCSSVFTKLTEDIEFLQKVLIHIEKAILL